MAAPRPSTIVCDVSTFEPDAVTIDVLARLQLTARRFGFEIRLRNASEALQDLLAFVGLDDVVLRLEAGGQTEKGEHGLGVEEERELDDPAV